MIWVKTLGADPSRSVLLLENHLDQDISADPSRSVLLWENDLGQDIKCWPK